MCSQLAFVIFWNLTTFTTTCGSLCRRSVQRLVSGSWNESFDWHVVNNFDFNVPAGQTGSLQRFPPVCEICGTGTSTTLSTTDRFCTARHDAHSDGFLRHLRNHDVDDLFNDDALLTLAVCTATHLVPASAVRSIILSCGIALTFLLMERRSPRSFYPNLHLLLALLLRNLANVLLLRTLDSLLHQLVGRGNCSATMFVGRLMMCTVWCMRH